jgi:hypothetical protein
VHSSEPIFKVPFRQGDRQSSSLQPTGEINAIVFKYLRPEFVGA